MFIPATNCMKAAVVQTYLNEPVVNIFWAKTTVAPTFTNLNDFAAFLAGAYSTYLTPIFTADWKIDKISVQDWTSFNGQSVEYIPPVLVQGAAAGDSTPGQVAAVNQWLTGLRGRSYRGRTYFAGLSENYTTKDTVHATAVTAIDDFATHLLTTAFNNGWPMQVVSFQANNQQRLTAVATQMTGHRVRTKLRTQRRRSSSLTA